MMQYAVYSTDSNSVYLVRYIEYQACNPPKPTTGHNSHTGSHDKSAAAASSAVATSGVHRSLSKEDKKKEKKQKKEKKSKGSSPTSVAETETGPLQHTSKRQIFEFCQ